MMAIHKHYYAAAAMEVASGVMDHALWIKARVEAGSDEAAQDLYIQLRAAELAREGVKDRAKAVVKKGMWLWHGRPIPGHQAQQHEGILPRLLLLVVVIALIAGVASIIPSNKLTFLSSGSKQQKYDFRPPIDCEGRVPGQAKVDAQKQWQGIDCTASSDASLPHDTCDADIAMVTVAGQHFTGSIRVFVDTNGVLLGGFVAPKDADVTKIKQGYERMWGPGQRQERNPWTREPGWTWQKNGVQLFVQDGKVEDGTLQVGATLLDR